MYWQITGNDSKSSEELFGCQTLSVNHKKGKQKIPKYCVTADTLGKGSTTVPVKVILYVLPSTVIPCFLITFF